MQRNCQQVPSDAVYLDPEDAAALFEVLGTRYHLRWHAYFERVGKRNPRKKWNFEKHIAFGANITRPAPGQIKRTYLHRWVWERHHGPITKGYQVHHVDGNKANNRLSNLELLTIEEHSRKTYQEKLAGVCQRIDAAV